MSSGLVLVIEDDEWVSRLLSVAIREAGFEAALCTTAEAGVETAKKREPDCIVCDVDLPDHDGFWVARNVRTLSSRVSVTPFLFLSSLSDQESRLRGFHVGADVYMTKPFRVDEVVAQVAALVQMASRLRQRRDTLLSLPPEEATAIEGDLSQMSIATVLTVLEMERRTGNFEVASKKRKALLDIASGCIEAAKIGGSEAEPTDALRAMLSWHVGRFSFIPAPARDAPPNQRSIGAILLDAARLEDERHESEVPISSRRFADFGELSAPTLGGPGSELADMAPPSTHGGPEDAPPTADDLMDADDADDEWEPISFQPLPHSDSPPAKAPPGRVLRDTAGPPPPPTHGAPPPVDLKRPTLPKPPRPGVVGPPRPTKKK